MSGLFGGGKRAKEAAKVAKDQAAASRRATQRQNETSLREQQSTERSTIAPGGGRSLFSGDLSNGDIAGNLSGQTASIARAISAMFMRAKGRSGG